MTYFIELTEAILRSRTFKIGLLAGIGMAASWSLGNGIVSLNQYLSIGALVRSSMLPALLLGAFVVLAATNLEGISLENFRPRWHWAAIAWLSGLAVPLAFATALMGYLGVTLGLLILVAAVGVLLALFFSLTRDDSSGLSTFLLTLPFLAYVEWYFTDTFFGGGFWGPVTVSPSIVTIWGLFAATLIHRRAAGKGILGTPIDKFVLAWGFVLFLASLHSQDPTRSFRDFSLDVLVGPLFLWIVINKVHTRRDLLWVVMAAVIYGVLRLSIVYYILTQIRGAGTTLATGSTLRIVVHWGILDWIALFTIPLALSLALYRRNKGEVLLWLVLGAISTLFLLLTELRSGVIALVATTPIFFLNWRRGLRWALTFLCLGASLFAYLYVFNPIHLPSKFAEWRSLNAIIEQQGHRLDYWQASLAITKDNPILGVGPGMVGDYYPLYAKQTLYGPSVMNHPHQILLHYSTQAGVGAALLLFIVFAMCSRHTLANITNPLLRDIHPLAIGLWWTFGAMTVSSLIGGTSFAAGTLLWPLPGQPSSLIIMELGLLFWLAVGLVFAFNRLSKGPMR